MWSGVKKSHLKGRLRSIVVKGAASADYRSPVVKILRFPVVISPGLLNLWVLAVPYRKAGWLEVGLILPRGSVDLKLRVR